MKKIIYLLTITLFFSVVLEAYCVEEKTWKVSCTTCGGDGYYKNRNKLKKCNFCRGTGRETRTKCIKWEQSKPGRGRSM